MTAESPSGRLAPAVLLIGGGFFGYAAEIAALLERRGRRVLRYEDRPATDTVTKALVRLAPYLVAARAEAYFDAIIDEVRGQPIGDVLVIKGESLSTRAIARLRAALPAARFTLYFWDSYRNMPGDSHLKPPLFDRAYTFDPVDAQSDPSLTYRPLWFLDEYRELRQVPNDIDVLFFGTAHTDRYPVVKRLAAALPAGTRFEKVLYFPSRGLYRFRRVFDPALRGAQRSEFIFVPLAKAEILALIARTRVVVDIERAIQSGLTMRTIETLGAGKKLITTNPAVLQADFYDPANIAVIDRLRPHVDPAFLAGAYLPPPPGVIGRYSLSGWLDEVLGT